MLAAGAEDEVEDASGDPAAAAARAGGPRKAQQPLAPLTRRFEKQRTPFGAGQAGTDAAPVDPLSRDGWIRTTAPSAADSFATIAPGPRGQSADPALHWRYPDLDDALADPPLQRPDLRAALADSDPVVAANAAIALGRARDAAGMAQLVAAVRNRQLKLSMRCAAAEALGCLPSGGPSEAIRELIDQFGQSGPDARARYQADLHAELLRALARHVDPAGEPRFIAALRSPSPEAQVEAVRAWQHSRGEMPAKLADLRTARDARVRAAVLETLARRRHPQAGEWLLAALGDWEATVRVAAIAGLGELADPPSREALRRAAHDRAELIRAAAVTALARAGDRQAVAEAAADKSWRVRQAVARALALYPDRSGAALARNLLDDPSPSVPPAVLDAVQAWPLEHAGPVLLEAMARDAFLVRKQAGAQLAGRWPPGAGFAPDAPAERRKETLDRLTRDFRAQVGFADRAALAAAGVPAARAGPGQVSPERLAEAEQLLTTFSDAGATSLQRRQAGEALAALGPDLGPALEQIVRGRKRPLPEAVYLYVLTEAGPEFAALDRFSSQDAALRRRAAAELAEIAAQRPLGWLATDRLAAMVAAEPDPLVWRSVLTAVAADGAEPAMRIAAAGLGHPSSEVRRRACEHFAAHPEAARLGLLLPALKDPSDAVALAAVKAVAAVGRLDDPGPLEQLLGHDHQAVRLEAAKALARFGRPSGIEALERLAYSGDPVMRREAAIAMGEVRDPSFAGTLVRLLDDGHGIRRAALDALPQVVGRDVAQAAGATPSVSERVDAWKRWHERRADGAGTGARKAAGAESRDR